MKKFNYSITLFFLITSISLSHASLFDYFGFGTTQNENQSKIRIPLGINEKKEQLERLKADLFELQKTEKEFLDTIQTQLDLTTTAINETKKKLGEASPKDSAFLNKALSNLNETYS